MIPIWTRIMVWRYNFEHSKNFNKKESYKLSKLNEQKIDEIDFNLRNSWHHCKEHKICWTVEFMIFEIFGDHFRMIHSAEEKNWWNHFFIILKIKFIRFDWQKTAQKSLCKHWKFLHLQPVLADFWLRNAPPWLFSLRNIKLMKY